eukprot:2589517-Amphidinium_carterae.1
MCRLYLCKKVQKGLHTCGKFAVLATYALIDFGSCSRVAIVSTTPNFKQKSVGKYHRFAGLR